MNAFDAGHSPWAQASEASPDGALDFLLRRLEVIEGYVVPVTKSSLVLLAANDRHRLAALHRVTAMKG
jgi:hypothetical protein